MDQTNQPALTDSQQHRDAQFPRQYDDEISLIDLGKVLYKRFWVMVFVGTVCVVAALAFALIQKPSYTFRSVLEVGSIPAVTEEGEERPIENSESLLARVVNSSIPRAMQAYTLQATSGMDEAAAATAQIILPKIMADTPNNSRLLVLSNSLTNDFKEIERAEIVHELILNDVLETHVERVKTLHEGLAIQKRNLESQLRQLKGRTSLETQLAGLRVKKSQVDAKVEKLTNDELRQLVLQRLERDLTAAERQMQSLREQETNLRDRMKRQTEEKEQLLNRQLSRAQTDLQTLQQSRQNVIGQGQSAQLAQSLLLIDSQINSAQGSVRTLENNLYLDLPEETANMRREMVELLGSIRLQESLVAEARQAVREFKITRALAVQEATAEVQQVTTEIDRLEAEYQNQLEQLQNRIADVNNRMEQIQESRIQMRPQRDSQPESNRKMLILALGVVLGGILGIMAAFFAEFAARV
ncbi:MAG: hypothetical protein IBX50_18780, partial [Marinospirillum sp.]|uniref:Wzz/FepE/Etk N-terminal domain-containing protein n=1 Tax=Marinospirillum sp. TaxID=2183934 RepID=UPI0019E09710